MTEHVAATRFTVDMPDVMAILRAKDAEEPLFVRVLRALDRSPAALTGRQVAARLQVSPTTGIGCLEHLAELGAVVKERRGRANIWRITDTARRFLVNRAQ